MANNSLIVSGFLTFFTGVFFWFQYGAADEFYFMGTALFFFGLVLLILGFILPSRKKSEASISIGQENSVYCRYCGAVMASSQAFCQKCGRSQV